MKSRWESTAETGTRTSDGREQRRAEKRRRARRRAAFGLALVAVVATLTGVWLGRALREKPLVAAAPNGAAPAATPEPGGVITVSYSREPDGLDPAIARDSEAQTIERLTYQTLVTYASKPGLAGTQLVPDLATEVPTTANGGISAGGTVYTFHLDPHASFAPPLDERVTAGDVKWSLERMLRHSMAPAKSFYSSIAGATAYMDGGASSVTGLKALGRDTLRITLDAPDGAFLHKLAAPFASILSEKWCAKVGSQIDRRPLGSGPYVIRTWTAGRRIEAVRNPASARTTARGGWADRMVFVFLPAAEALPALRKGAVDILGDGVPEGDYAQLRDSGPGGHLVDAPQLAAEYLFINVNQAPFNAVNVRRAVSYAIDKEQLEPVVEGHALALHQLYPAGLPAQQPNRHFYSYDPSKARYLLERAGYQQGFTTTLFTNGVHPQPELAEAIRRDLSEVGIAVQVKTIAPSAYWSFISLQASKAPLMLANWYQDYPDPSDWIGPLFDDPVDGGNDFSFYQRGSLTQLSSRAAKETDQTKRLRMYAQMQDLVMRDAPAVPLLQPVLHTMSSEDVGGFYVHPVLVLDLAHYWKSGGR